MVVYREGRREVCDVASTYVQAGLGRCGHAPAFSMFGKSSYSYIPFPGVPFTYVQAQVLAIVAPVVIATNLQQYM